MRSRSCRPANTRNYKQLVERPRAGLLRSLYGRTPIRATPDFNYRSFRTTNVLRWEYKPGSSLFVVWQQGRSGDGELRRLPVRPRLRRRLQRPVHNVFLVKLSYWLNM